MGNWARTLRLGAVGAIAASGFMVIGAPAVYAETPPPSLTLLVDGQPIQDTSVVESGTTITAVASSLLEPGDGTRELRVDLDATTIYQSGGVTAPEGWTVQWSTDDGATWVGTEPVPPEDVTNVRATSAVSAGEIVLGSQRYTKNLDASVPASTFSGATGGDGWDVFFYDDYVLNVFHHNSGALPLDCHLRSTGDRCAGFNPTVNVSSGVTGSRFPGYQSGDRSGGWVDGDTGFAYLFTTESATGTPGALCVDLNSAPPVSCGFKALSSATNVTSYSYLSNAEGVGGRLFGLESINQQLLCLDPATGAACAGSPVQLSGGTSTALYHVYPLDSKVFASTNTTLYCFEAATLAACGGAWPVTYASLGWTAVGIPPVAHMDASGVIDGVCLWNGCLDLAGAKQDGWVNPNSITPWAANASLNTYGGSYGRFEASAGRAFMLSVLSGSDVYCFDYATEAACDGFAEQVIDTALYALRADPNNPACIWYNSDPGRIGLFSAYSGAISCAATPVITLQPTAFAPRFVCQSSGGIDRWISFKMTALNGTNPVSTQTLTMRTGNGVLVPGWSSIPIVVNQLLDMSALQVADTGARPTFNVAFELTSGSLASAEFEVVYEGRGPELCVDLTLDNTGAPGAPNCPQVVDLTASVTEDVGGAVTTDAPDRSIVASGSATECPENIILSTPPSAPTNASGVPGATCELRFAPPADDGGSPIRWYEVSIDGGAFQVASTTPDGSGGFIVTVGCPAPGASSSVSVRAVNLIGSGTPAVFSLSVPLATTPTTAAPSAPTTTVSPAVVTIPPTGGTETGTASLAVLFIIAGASALFVARRRTSI